MKVLKIALIGSALLVSGGAFAKDRPTAAPTPGVDQYYGVYHTPAAAASPTTDSADFDHSGTRGREDLGASPFNPEGPGNFEE